VEDTPWNLSEDPALRAALVEALAQALADEIEKGEAAAQVPAAVPAAPVRRRRNPMSSPSLIPGHHRT
jgi:hypothetical protein